MRTSQTQLTEVPFDTAGCQIPALVELAIGAYVEWRETAGAVGETYAQWSTAPISEQSMRYAAYVAALDQEEGAAAIFADSVGDLARGLRA